MEISHIVVLALVTLAAGFDLRNHRIPNALTYSSWLVGLVLAAALAGWQGLTNSALGFVSCFIPLLLLFIGGSLGGGDVKLMGGVGALLGFPTAVNALISSILVGGLLAAVILLWQGRLYGLARYGMARVWQFASRGALPDPPPVHKDAFPFGVAIALGTYMTIASLYAGQNTPGDVIPHSLFSL